MRITRIRALFALCGAVVVVALILVVGTFWFGWYETSRVRAVLDSLPVPLDAQYLSDYPHGIELDESFLTPPDGWATLRTYRLGGAATRDDLIDFYLSTMTPEWEGCLRHVATWNPQKGESGVMLMGVAFVKEDTMVNVDAINLGEGGPRTYDVYVERQRRFNPCD